MILGLAQSLESEVSKRQATLQLNGNDNNYLASGAILLVIVGAIVFLDFAIFGTYASRSDELNPVSRFFFHARNGLQNIRNRRRHSLAHYYHRHQRFLNSNLTPQKYFNFSSKFIFLKHNLYFSGRSMNSLPSFTLYIRDKKNTNKKLSSYSQLSPPSISVLRSTLHFTLNFRFLFTQANS